MKNTLLEYFDAFNSKDLDKLSQLYADDIDVVDWTAHYSGKEQVLSANSEMFDAFGHVSIQHKDSLIYEGDSAIACEVAIILSSGVHPGIKERAVAVVNIIEFNSDAKISTIKSYLGASSTSILVEP